MSQIRGLIGLDNEKLSSHWGFSRRGMHNGVVDANSNQTKDGAPPRGRDQNKEGGERARASEGADENSGKRSDVGKAAAHFFDRLAALFTSFI